MTSKSKSKSLSDLKIPIKQVIAFLVFVIPLLVFVKVKLDKVTELEHKLNNLEKQPVIIKVIGDINTVDGKYNNLSDVLTYTYNGVNYINTYMLKNDPKFNGVPSFIPSIQGPK